jgi:hypothetical protein
MKQKKDYQDRQDAELGESIYIDYMHDPFFHGWTVQQRSEYYNKQITRLTAQKIDWQTDARFKYMSTNDRQNLKRKIRGGNARTVCSVS